MIPSQVDSNILKARNFFVTANNPASARRTTSGWGGPVNLLTYGGGGQKSEVRNQRSVAMGDGLLWNSGIQGLVRREKSPHPPT